MDQSRTRGRRGLLATAAVVLCVAGGLGVIGAALASQRTDPRMPPVSRAAETPMRAGQQARSAAARLTLPSSKPVRLEIPSIGVDSVVQHLGLDSQGGLEVPAPGPRYDEVAWYHHSPAPGALGPAVLLGHIDSAANGPSVFFRLGELRPGARITITRADESIAIFVVDAVHRYAKKNFPTRLVYGDIGHAGLRILTCGGAFDRTTRHYLDNIVVFASLVAPAAHAVPPRTHTPPA